MSAPLGRSGSTVRPSRVWITLCLSTVSTGAGPPTMTLSQLRGTVRIGEDFGSTDGRAEGYGTGSKVGSVDEAGPAAATVTLWAHGPAEAEHATAAAATASKVATSAGRYNVTRYI